MHAGMVAPLPAPGQKRRTSPDSGDETDCLCRAGTARASTLAAMTEPRTRTLARRPAALVAAVATAVLAASVIPAGARADGRHVVHAGQSLARIAERHDVSVGQLAAANGLARTSALRAGQVLRVPRKGELYVGAGDTLASLARLRGVPIDALARANHLPPGATLRVGQRLVLPGANSDGATAGEARWGAPKRPGVATFYRVWSREERAVRLVNARGKAPPEAVRTLRHLLRPRNSTRRRDPAPRLLQLLAEISDHFGGRPLHVISGYRPAGGTTRPTSQHVQGHAIDFRIPGVPLRELRDFCARFEDVGVGLYPTSGFVHLDVRPRSARWVDESARGESAANRAAGDDGTGAALADGDPDERGADPDASDP